MLPDSTPLVANPFAALAAVAGPAVLTNACSVLTLATGNRLARVVDRTRVVAKEISLVSADPAAHDAWVQQLEYLDIRSRMLVKALRRFYASLGLFATAALLSAIGSVLATYGQQLLFRLVAIAALVSGASAVVSLVAGCVGTVRETRLAVLSLGQEAGLRPQRQIRPPHSRRGKEESQPQGRTD